MTRYDAPIKDMQFLLHDVLRLSASDTPGYGDLDEGFTGAVLEEAGKLARDVLAPLNAVGDREGCVLENGVVRTPTGFKAAFDALRNGGWPALDCDPAYGGQGLPYLMGTAVGEIFVAANMAFNMYQGLTHGAYSAIHVHGTDAQKAMYLPHMVTNTWTGTMNLTEPQCGTDLGLMRTRAEPQDDGSYLITGTKIFISAGDHDMADNIIHLVLAKAPGGGEGTRGISLFIVPKVLVNADGSLGARNAVSVGKVEEKMGIHGNATCVMNYDGARGWLLGDLHKGMRAMFTMMNEARLGVGLQGYAQAEAAYQNAVSYARDRLQGRAVTGVANPQGPADPLIVHPDIRRSLMDQKSFVEGARALTFWAASLIDRSHRSGDAAAEGLVSLMIPVIKGFQTDKGFEMAVQAQQIWGGHGYIEDNGMSQFARDARIAMIYEGANGVQAMDLVGRKLAMNGGRAVQALFAAVDAECAGVEGDLAPVAERLAKANAELKAATMWFMQNAMANPNNLGAGAYAYMTLMGIVAVGLMWLRMAKVAATALADGGAEDAAFYQAKLVTARHFAQSIMPDAGALRRKIEAGSEAVMALPPEAFATA